MSRHRGRKDGAPLPSSTGWGMKGSFSYRPISPPPNVTKPAIMARTATAAKIHTQRGKRISVGKGDETCLGREGLKNYHELKQPCSQHGQAFTKKNRRRSVRLLRSSFGDDPAFRAAAEAIGSGIAQMGYSLVFGGGGLGLMGVVAKAALDGGSEIQEIYRASCRR